MTRAQDGRPLTRAQLFRVLRKLREQRESALAAGAPVFAEDLNRTILGVVRAWRLA